MKISRRRLNILIERFLLEKDEDIPGNDEIPFVGSEDNPRGGTNPETEEISSSASGSDNLSPADIRNAALDRGDGWGFYKIQGPDYFYVRQGDYKGENSNWKKLNKKGIDALKKSIADGKVKIKEKFKSGHEELEQMGLDALSGAEDEEKVKLDKMPSGLNVGKKVELKKRVKEGLAGFLSAYLGELNEVYSFSDQAIRALTNGEKEITSKNIEYSKKSAKTILNPFIGSKKSPPPKVKKAHVEMLKQISLLLSKQMTDMRIEKNIIDTYFDDLNFEENKTIQRITRVSLGRIENVGKSVNFGDIGKNYTADLFYKYDVKDLFFKPEDFK